MPAKGKGKRKGLYDSGVGEENETEDRADHPEKEKHEQHGEGAPDDAWWLRCVGGQEFVSCNFHF